MLLQKQQRGAATLSLSPWNSKLLVPIGATANKFFVLKLIFVVEKVEFSGLFSYVRIIYYRKSDTWSCSFNLFVGLQKYSLLAKKEHPLWKIPSNNAYLGLKIWKQVPKAAVYFKYVWPFFITWHEGVKGRTIKEKSFCEFLILALLSQTLIRK